MSLGRIMTETTGFATALIQAHLNGTRIVPPVSNLSRSEILTVQADVSAALGPVAGFKVGRVPGAPPILAPIPARYCVANGGTRAVSDRLGVELELGFELIETLPSDALPARPEIYFRPCVVLELVDTRLSGSAAELASLKFADLQINAGLVIGDQLNAWDGADFGALEAHLVTETETVLCGPATVPGGSALSNLELLITHLGNHCGGLQVGQTLITGSICGLPYFSPGTRISGGIKGLGSVCVTLGRAPDQASERV